MLRQERIERLLAELRYEIQIGMLQGEIDESLGYEWIVPSSKAIPEGVVFCSFRTRPLPYYSVSAEMREPRLRVVK
jgi:hypothetical protein